MVRSKILILEHPGGSAEGKEPLARPCTDPAPPSRYYRPRAQTTITTVCKTARATSTKKKGEKGGKSTIHS